MTLENRIDLDTKTNMMIQLLLSVTLFFQIANAQCPPGSVQEIKYKFICDNTNKERPSTVLPSIGGTNLLGHLRRSQARCRVQNIVNCIKVPTSALSKSEIQRQSASMTHNHDCSVEYRLNCRGNVPLGGEPRCQTVPVQTCLKRQQQRRRSILQRNSDCRTIHTKQCDRASVCRIVPRTICENDKSLDGIDQRRSLGGIHKMEQLKLSPILKQNVVVHPENETEYLENFAPYVKKEYIHHDLRKPKPSEPPPPLTTGRSSINVVVDGVIKRLKKVVGLGNECEICECDQQSLKPSCYETSMEKCDVTTQRSVLEICNNVINRICKPSFALKMDVLPEKCVTKTIEYCSVEHKLKMTPSKYLSCTTVPKINCRTLSAAGLRLNNCTQEMTQICRNFDIFEVGTVEDKTCTERQIVSCFSEAEKDLIRCKDIEDVICGEQETTELVPNECSYETATTCSSHDQNNCTQRCRTVKNCKRSK